MPTQTPTETPAPMRASEPQADAPDAPDAPETPAEAPAAADPADAPPPEADRRVPVTEAIGDRQRAQSAEQALAEARRRLGEVERDLGAARETITSLERRQRIDAALAEADAIDLEAARLLTEAAVQQMDEQDVELAIADLRRHRPYLFRQRPADGGATMAPHAELEPDPADRAAHRAVHTGRRRDLLEYLRLRRAR